MVKGLISKIQHYSTKDGPGIRTTVFMMGCNLRCLWCANPENLEHKQQVFYFKERCQKCGLCVKHASNHSIKFAEVGCDINRSTCDNLLDMVDLCPFDAYELVGKEYTVDELVKVLVKDKVFYESSGGGVTFSGGEAALQSEFIIEVCKKLKEENIHVCLDTAGCFDQQILAKLLVNVDLVLFDVKTMDNDKHKQCTAVSNVQILDNLNLLAASNVPYMVRMIVVCKYTDDVKDRIDYVANLERLPLQIDVLKYHIFGIGKYEKLGIKYPIMESIEVDDAYIKEVVDYGTSKGLKMTIGG